MIQQADFADLYNLFASLLTYYGNQQIPITPFILVSIEQA